MPTIGMGAKGYPAKVVAKAMLEAIAEYAEKNPSSSIKNVKLYLYDKEIKPDQQKVCCMRN